MSVFRRLIIENFQSHVVTEIDLVDGLNVFVGPSDSGKSSILRALRWVLFNHPRGTDFIREGAEQCRVSLTLTDGTELVRLRSKKKALNRYILRKVDAEEEIFESLGVGPHPMILEAHGIYPLDRDTYVQVGSQLDAPFLLSETGGNKAKLIGRISGAHWIDLALKEATKDRNKLQSQMRHLEQQEVNLTEKLQPYENVPQMEKQLLVAEQQYTESMEKKQFVQRLKQYQEQWQRINAEKQGQQIVLDSLSTLPTIERRQLQCEQMLFHIKQWKQLTERRKYLREQQNKYQKQLMETAHIDDAEQQIYRVRSKVERLQQLRGLESRYTHLGDLQKACQAQLTETEHIADIEKKLRKISAKMQRISVTMGLFAHQSTTKKALEAVAVQLQNTNKTRDSLENIPKWQETLERVQKLRTVYAQYTLNQENLYKGKQFMLQNEEEIIMTTTRYKQLFEQLGRCPTCGAAVHETSLQHILG